VVLGPGETVERYQIVRLLGSGGMGHVYEARDPRLLRNVALKVLSLDASQRAHVGHQRLLHEARLAAALEHPNVVAVYDVGEVEPVGDRRESTMYLAMELIAGRSLRDYVGDPSVPVKERIRWLRDVASALVAAHARGMVHRDVKPENVMVREDGVVKVLDFGIAKRDPAADPSAEPIVPITAEGVTIGTPYYMAPEQMRGQQLDGRADQFAWGVMGYELLTGALPWGEEATDTLQILANMLSQDPPLLTNKNPDVPTAVAAAVMRALARLRDQRFPSMTALLDAMDGDAEVPLVTTRAFAVTATSERDPALANTLAVTRLLADGVTAATKPRRRRAIAVAATSLGLAAIVGAILLVRQSSARQAHEAAAPLATSTPDPVQTQPPSSAPAQLSPLAAPSSAPETPSVASAATTVPRPPPRAPGEAPRPPTKPAAAPAPTPPPASNPYEHM
jgi:serine/threonine protein kinase